MVKIRTKRWRLLADTKIQGAMCLRIASYWIVCQTTLLGTMACFYFLTNGEGNISGLAIPGLLVSSLFLPIALLDALKFSNRFAGPVVNIRGKLKRFAATGTMETIRLRKGDYYSDICEAFNQIPDVIAQQYSATTAQTAAPKSTLQSKSTNE